MKKNKLIEKLFVGFVLLFSLQIINAQTKPIKSKLFDANQLIADIKTLSADEMQGRSFGTPSGAKARDYVLQRFKESRLQMIGDSYLQPFEINNRRGEKIKGNNVVGLIKGKKFPNKYIVVTAHYDHVGVQDGQIFNGADDNASGTGALFAMAKYFSQKQPLHSIIFVAFDGEESGLLGARHFVKEPPVEKSAILMNVNMDMISRNDKDELYASGTYHHPQFKKILEPFAKSKESKVKLLLGHDQPNPPRDDWTSQSDQGAFHQAKIPFIYFGVEDHKDYHKPTDDFENINQSFYVRAVETILGAVKLFDKNLTN